MTEDDVPIAWLQEEAVREAVAVHEAVEGAWVEVEGHPQDERHVRFTVAMRGAIDDVEVEETGSLLLRQKRGVCDRCSRIAGGYYAAIIQVRATDRPVTSIELDKSHKILASELDRQRVGGNRFSFLAKSGPEHGGYDYYIGDIDAARGACRILSKRLGASVTESPKLVGRKEGVDVYRITFLVRIAWLAPGDYVEHEGDPFMVLSVDRGRVSCINVATHGRGKIVDKGLKRLGGEEILEEAVVVSHVGGPGADAQVLDPRSGLTRDVRVPPAVGGLVETVRLLRTSDDDLFVAPVLGGPEPPARNR